MSRLIKSFEYAFKGLKYAFITQPNYRIHVFAALMALLAGVLLHLSANEWLWIMLSVALVLGAELLNTAIELLTDIVSPAYSEKAGHVKDIAAAAVTVAAVFAFLTGLLIFAPKISRLF